MFFLFVFTSTYNIIIFIILCVDKIVNLNLIAFISFFLKLTPNLIRKIIKNICIMQTMIFYFRTKLEVSLQQTIIWS